jgi:hypothetical protein
VKTEERSKENRAIPMVGENLALEGCTVKKDAQESQYKKAEQQEKRKVDGLFSQQEKQERQYECEEEYV